MRISRLLFLLFLIFSSVQAFDAQAQDKFTLGGYIKYLQIASFQQDPNTLLTDNFFHNRLNFRYYPSQSWTFALEARNRFFYGESVKLNPLLGTNLDQDPGYLDLSFLILDESSYVLHSMIDRAYGEYFKGKWNIRLGRQRVNWGMSLVWNPNDLFNAYNYLDFDYEERPGNDAVRIQYYTGLFSSLDLAVKPGEDEDDWIAALKYKFNRWNYDFQVLGGWYYTDVAVGAGWAGNIKTAGFKGEATYFHPRENMSDTNGTFLGTAGIDYSFSNGFYIQGAGLYNSDGLSEGATTSFDALLNSRLSAKNIYPFKYSAMVSAMKSITPLLNANLSVIYSPGIDATIVFPTITYSIAENWDLDLIAQSFFFDNNGEYQNLSNAVFMRIKWSY